MKRNNRFFALRTIQMLFLLLGGISFGLSQSLYAEYKTTGNGSIPFLCKILDACGIVNIIFFCVSGVVHCALAVKGNRSRPSLNYKNASPLIREKSSKLPRERLRIFRRVFSSFI